MDHTYRCAAPGLYALRGFVTLNVIVNEEPEIMKAGQCFTIEPCIIQGSQATGWIFPDGWTASTEVRLHCLKLFSSVASNACGNASELCSQRTSGAHGAHNGIWCRRSHCIKLYFACNPCPGVMPRPVICSVLLLCAYNPLSLRKRFKPAPLRTE
jgi:hypothetical protein